MQRSLFGTKDSSGEAKNGSGQLVTLNKKKQKNININIFFGHKKKKKKIIKVNLS